MSKELYAGQYKTMWDGTNDSGTKVSSGTYIYQLKAGDMLKSRKLVLLK